MVSVNVTYSIFNYLFVVTKAPKFYVDYSADVECVDEFIPKLWKQCFN